MFTRWMQKRAQRSADTQALKERNDKRKAEAKRRTKAIVNARGRFDYERMAKEHAEDWKEDT